MDESVFQRAIDLPHLPRACPECPRVSGRIKVEPEDFEVEEVPAYEPEGAGAHLFLWVEKRDCSGGELLRRVGAMLGLDPGEVGAAGTKDRRAVTRQWLSVPAEVEGRLGALVDAAPRIRVLRVTRHGNKLRLGHLRGNRFRIRVRGADVEALPALSTACACLERDGFFNLYGPQRFGHGGETLRDGLALLAGDGADPRERRRRSGRFERRMMVSAIQSALFNLYVAARVEGGLDGRVLRGDVMQKTETGGLFWAEDPAVEQVRLEAGETRLTGPMFGHKLMAARAEAGDLESSILESASLTPASFKVFTGLAEGTRRALRVRPADLSVAADPDGVLFTFFLPKGCYASVMLREFVVDEAAAGADGEG